MSQPRIIFIQLLVVFLLMSLALNLSNLSTSSIIADFLYETVIILQGQWQCHMILASPVPNTVLGYFKASLLSELLNSAHLSCSLYLGFILTVQHALSLTIQSPDSGNILVILSLHALQPNQAPWGLPGSPYIQLHLHYFSVCSTHSGTVLLPSSNISSCFPNNANFVLPASAWFHVSFLEEAFTGLSRH